MANIDSNMGNFQHGTICGITYLKFPEPIMTVTLKIMLTFQISNLDLYKKLILLNFDFESMLILSEYVPLEQM